MKSQQLKIVHFVNMIRSNYKHKRRSLTLEQPYVLEHSVGSAGINPARFWRQTNERRALFSAEGPVWVRSCCFHVLLKRSMLVLYQRVHVFQVGIHAIRSREIDQPEHATKRDQRLRPVK